MKHLNLLLTMLCFSLLAQAQTSGYYCHIDYTYDAAGNRTQRQYNCTQMVAPEQELPSYYTQSTARPAASSQSNSNASYSEYNPVLVFPNPNKGLFKVSLKEFKEGYIVKVFTTQGACIKQEALTINNQEFDIRIFANGAYIIKVELNGQGGILPLIKE
jgi:hypothetical protein